MKLCVFQGTFNPIHKAHLRVAEFIADKIKPDKFLFIPAYIPPHKNSDVKFAKHRLNMVRLAVEDDNRFEVSDIEFHREGKSYTYDTILELYKIYDITDKIYILHEFALCQHPKPAHKRKGVGIEAFKRHYIVYRLRVRRTEHQIKVHHR